MVRSGSIEASEFWLSGSLSVFLSVYLLGQLRKMKNPPIKSTTCVVTLYTLPLAGVKTFSHLHSRHETNTIQIIDDNVRVSSIVANT